MRNRLTVHVSGVLLAFAIACYGLFILFFNPENTARPFPKINGISFVAPPQPATSSCFALVKNTGANQVAIVPYAFVRPGEPTVHFNSPRQWYGERPEGIAQSIALARQHQLKIMLKPQIWAMGTFTGHLTFNSEAGWRSFENSYAHYLLTFARMADSLEVEMLCMGTELCSFVRQRPAFWAALIKQVRQQYSGQLTYAANWDTYQQFPHWQKLDYIGIDAYFPLSGEKTPDVASLKKAWQPHLRQISALQEVTGRPVLFTEFGYRNTDFATAKPWNSEKGLPLNMQAQVNAYHAIFDIFWPEEWFAGGFLWKWFSQEHRQLPLDNTSFSPQNKPAQQTLSRFYRTRAQTTK